MKLLTTILRDLHTLINGVEADVTAFLASLADSIARSGGQTLIHAAVNAVATAEATGGTGAEKFAAAFAAVTHDLATQGIAAAESAVRGAIEAAVAQHKAAPAA